MNKKLEPTTVSFKLSLFWRYFFLLAMMALLFLSSLSFYMNSSGKSLQDVYTKQVQETFYQNCSSFSEDFKLTHFLITTINNSEYYVNVFYAQKPFTGQHYYYFSKMRDFFSVQCDLLLFVQDGFIYNEHSGLCITKNRFYQDIQTASDSYFLCEGGLYVTDMISSANSRNGLYVFPAQQMSIGQEASASYLTILLNPSSSKLTYGFFYSTDIVLERFDLNTLPENTYLVITSSDQTIYSYHADNLDASDYIEFSSDIPSLACTATLGIPQSYFDHITEESQAAAHKIFLLSVILGFALCVLFSYLGIKPFRFLVREHNLISGSSQNELEAIDNFLKTTKQRNETLRSMLLSSVLIRTFHGLPVKKNEFASLSYAFPIFQKSLRLALLQDLNPNDASQSPDLLSVLLPQHCPKDFLYEHLNMSAACILMPSSCALAEMRQFLLHINQAFPQVPRFVCGVSAPFTSLEHLTDAMKQAQLALPQDEAHFMVIFEDKSELYTQSTPAAIFNLNLFQQELSCWNEANVLNILQTYRSKTKIHSAEHPEEIFYNILFLLRNAAAEQKMSLGDHQDITYNYNLSSSANLRLLEEIARDLFRQKKEFQKSETQLLSESLVQYVKDHFSDPNLSIAVLTQEFCISEQFANKAILSICGMSFSKLLLEIRMQEAARLFRETEESVTAVSELCGFLAISTFYRNFKNYYKKTPAEYKESYSLGKEEKKR